MATDLTNVAVSTGYVQLLHIDGGVGGSATRVYDGDGTGTPLEISTTEVVIKDGSFNLDVASHDGTNGLKLGGTLVTTSAAELNLLDGITAGTVSASKFLLVDSNKDLSGLRNLTATGTITAANFTGTGNTQIGDAAADTVAMNATITTNLIFEGSTDNAYETTLAITDPTADRTWTIPDATDTSVGRATTDTLTNKTLTSPDINTPDIDGGTVDAITSLTVANSVDIGNYTLTANGLTIDGTFTDGTLSIASGSITSAVNGTFSGTVQAEQLTTTDDATISDQLSVDGTMTISTGSIVDSTGTISFGDENLTTTGVGTFASLDISGNADIDGTMEADAYTVDGTALNEYIADTVGAMVGSNTETNITVTYEDSDNTLDFVIGTLNQDTTGTADNFTVSANNSTDETVYPIFVDGATGSQGAESDTGLTYNPSSGMLTISGELDAGSLDISGNADIDGTLEADAITVDGTTLAEYISDTAGAMFSSNTESGITVTYQDGDNTIDLSVDAAQTGITSLLATDIKIGEDDQTKIDFEDADKINFYAGNEKQLILEDGALYPGSDNIIDLGKSDNEFKDAFFDGTVTADAFAGPLTGAVTGNADTATLATTVTVTDSSANTNFPVVFHNESNGLLDDTGALRYNPSTGELLVPKLTVAGTTTTVDTVTMSAQNAIVFEGATDDSYETTLSIVDPTADHTQYLVNQGGYIPVLAAATTTAISATPEEINLIDGGTARGTTAVASGDGILINDGGTMRMTNVDTVSTYFASHNVGGSNIVTTGALNSGSITSGFGSIDTGSSNITTTGVGSFGSLDISGNVDVDGTLEADAITVDSTALNEYIADTVGAMVGSNTETGIAVTYEDGDNTLDFVLGTTQTTVTSMLNASLVAGRDADNQIKFSTDDQIIFRVAGGDGVTMKASGEIEATSLDISGAIDVDGVVTANAGVVVDNITIDGTEIDLSSGDLTLDVAGDIYLDADGDNIKFQAAGTAKADLSWSSGGDVTFFTETSNADLYIKGNDGGSTITAMMFDMSEGGRVGIGTSPSEKLHIDGDFGDYRIYSRTGIENGTVAFNEYYTGSAWANDDDDVVSGAMRFSDSRDSLEFGVRAGGSTAGYSTTHMTIKSTGNIGIGTNAPSDLLHLSASVPIIRLTDSDTNDYHRIYGSNGSLYFDADKGDTVSSSKIAFGVDDSNVMNITDGKVGIGTGTPLEMLDVNKVNDGGLGPVLQLTNDPGSSTAIGTSCKIKFAPHHSGTEVASVEAIATTTGAGTDLKFTTHSGSALTEKMRIDRDGNVIVGNTTVHETRVGQYLALTAHGGTDRGGMAINSFLASNNGPLFDFNKSRNSTAGSHTVVQDDDALGTFIFRGDDGDEFLDAAAIEANVDNTPGNGDMPGRLCFYTSSDGGSSLSERMRIDSNGRVGVNLTNADSLFHVSAADGESDNNAVARFANSEATDGRSKGILIVAGSTADDWPLKILDHTGGTTMFNFTGAGRLGINIAAPNAKLHIHETTNGQECIFLNHSDTTADQTYLQFRHDGTQRGNIQVNNTTDQIAYNTTTSDKRLKKDFEDWNESILPAFKSLKPQLFNFIHSENNGGKRRGYMAQDNADSFPEAYTTSKVVDGDDTEYYSFNPTGMVTYLMKAVKELTEKVEALENA